MNLGERINQLRLERELSLEKAANALDPPTTGKTLSKWERGIEKPQIDNFAALARFFNVDADYLLGWSDERKPWPLSDQADALEGLARKREPKAGERRASGGERRRRRADSE
jgi:transcriptional regulator with XRE-family HTH domain